MGTEAFGVDCVFGLSDASVAARIVEFLSDWFGIQLSVGTVHHTIMESGRATMALKEPLANDMRDSGVLHIDETSWRARSTLLVSDR